MNRAYSLIEVKSLDEESRTFSGWATTPALDRVSDTIDPLKAVFAPELPLLHQHRHDAPIGRVRFNKPTKAGIPFEAKIPNIPEEGSLKDRVDTAWGELRHGLVRAVSVGFMPTEPPKRNSEGGYDYGEIEIFELSTVTIPANSEAIITAVKSLAPEALLTAVKEIDDDARFLAGVKDDPLPEIPLSPQDARKTGMQIARAFKDMADGVASDLLIPEDPKDDGATAKVVPVVKLDAPARDRAFVIRRIHPAKK